LAADVRIRVATTEDTEAVSTLLAASYPALLAPGYDAQLLQRALPFVTRANPALLRSGTYYVADAGAGFLAGCGGWTLERPDKVSDPVDAALAHIRHVATHPGWVRRGIGRLLFDRIVRDARAAGVKRFQCYSTTVAEPFYRALGFTTVQPTGISFAPDLVFPGLLMTLDLAE
jgi:N-acetylglutamate synthase-like GNAT family acetyltransferase